jgi:hypothetical protein
MLVKRKPPRKGADRPKKDISPSRRPSSWETFFELMKTTEVPDDFLADRKDSPPQKRRPIPTRQGACGLPRM